jgi:ribonuclease HI
MGDGNKERSFRMKVKKFRVFTDGGSRGNPGPGACAAAIFDEKGSLVREEGRYLGHCTNNFAEYNGLILALSLAGDLGVAALEVFSDSELLVKQFNGEYKIKDPALRGLMDEIKKGSRAFKSLTISHVRREANAHADRLVNEILDARAAGCPAPAGITAVERKRKLDQPELF